MLQGKTWMVKDVGLKPTSFGSQPAQDTPISIDWFSAAKELGEYETQAKESYAKASMTISMDTVITTVALEMLGPQTYLITDEPKENAQPGVRLEISGASEAFKEAGIVTFTYFVLGANDKMMLLQTPREINDRKVVLLLEGAAVH